MKNQQGITIVEVLLVLAVIGAMFAIGFRMMNTWQNRENLEQASKRLISDINSDFNDIRSGAYSVAEGIECFLGENAEISFRNNPKFKQGEGNQCFFVGVAFQLGMDTNTNRGGCILDPDDATNCKNDYIKHVDAYNIYTLMGSDTSADARKNFNSIKDLKVLANTPSLIASSRNVKADFIHFKSDKICNNPSTNSWYTHQQEYYCEHPIGRAGDGNPDPLRNFDTTIQKFFPQGATIKTSYIDHREDTNGNGVLDNEDNNGNGVLDAGEDANGNNKLDTEDTNGNGILDDEIIYVDGFIIVISEFGIETSESEDGFLGGSRTISIMALYTQDTLNDPTNPLNNRINKNSFIERLEQNDKGFYHSLSAPITICLAGATDYKILEVGSLTQGTLSVESNDDPVDIEKKCSGLPI